MLGKIFASELSPTPMTSLAIIRLVAKIMSQNRKAAHLLRVSKASATVFAKPDSSGSKPRMTESGVGFPAKLAGLQAHRVSDASLGRHSPLHPHSCACHRNGGMRGECAAYCDRPAAMPHQNDPSASPAMFAATM